MSCSSTWTSTGGSPGGTLTLEAPSPEPEDPIGTGPGDGAIQRRYRRRIAAFVAFALVAVVVLGVVQWTFVAVQRVDAVEAERDRWQRPADVLHALDAGDRKVVVDFGSGVGYFALRLADRVAPGGRVIAVDLRRSALRFLKIRALLRGRSNLATLRGDPDDPHLPAAGVDAVLVANTYHELTDSGAILDHFFKALRPGGRLVILDRSPDDDAPEAEGRDGDHHHASPAEVEARLRQSGFEIVNQDRRFIERFPERWWLLVARRP